jgi:hypothetical protein
MRMIDRPAEGHEGYVVSSLVYSEDDARNRSVRTRLRRIHGIGAAAPFLCSRNLP